MQFCKYHLICYSIFFFIFVFLYYSCSDSVYDQDNQAELLKSNKYDSIHIIAHRGFWKVDQANLSTNSIASLKGAQDYHLWGSEFDVRMTLDSVPIIYHDDSIHGMRIIDVPFNDISSFRLPNGESIPSLDDYLSVATEEPELVLVMELKWQYTVQMDSILVDKCIKSLKKYNLLDPKRVIFISFSSDICQRLAQKLPDFVIQALFATSSLEELQMMGLKGIDYYQDILIKNPEIISCAHDLDMGVNVWTVDNKDDMVFFISSGVDYITTDDPLTLRLLMLESVGK